MSERQRDPEVAKKPAYISYCRRCGGMTGCCADSPERAKDAAQFVSECIAGGLIIERKTAADVWSATWCNCPELMRGEPQEVQSGLFSEAQESPNWHPAADLEARGGERINDPR